MAHLGSLKWVAILALGIATLAQANKTDSKVFQYGTMNALEEGIYDSAFTFKKLAEQGNFGVGTFNAIDGEMVALDGEFYQIKANGKVSKVAPDQQTPFSIVTFFEPKETLKISNIQDYKQLQRVIDESITNKNIPHAIRITGKFNNQLIRSTRPQLKPYLPIEDVVKSQAEFHFEQSEGTLVGFWYPEYFKDVNIPGYHFHYLNKEKTTGGHVLEVSITEAQVEIAPMQDMQIALPAVSSPAATKLAVQSRS